MFTQPFFQAQIKKTIKAPRHWPLWGEFTGASIERRPTVGDDNWWHMQLSDLIPQQYSAIIAMVRNN